MKLIDLHAHILPAIDDGANDLQESIAILDAMIALGYESITLTPHLRQGMFPNKNDLIRSRFELFQHDTQNRFPIAIGGEYHYDHYFVQQLKAKDLITLNNSDYFLLEFNNHQQPPNIKELIYQIQLKGYTPIIAHPERYRYFQKDLKLVQTVKDQGALLQGSLSSFSKLSLKSYQKSAFHFIKEELFDFLSSDLHHLIFIEKHIAPLLKKIRKKCSKEYFEEITYNHAKRTIFQDIL